MSWEHTLKQAGGIVPRILSADEAAEVGKAADWEIHCDWNTYDYVERYSLYDRIAIEMHRVLDPGELHQWAIAYADHDLDGLIDARRNQ